MIEDYIQSFGFTNKHKISRLNNRLETCSIFGEDYETIKKHYQSILKKSGDHKGERQYKDETIEEILKEYKKYLEWEKSKGENIMTLEDKITTIQEQPEITMQEKTMPIKEKVLSESLENINEKETEATFTSPVVLELEEPESKRKGKVGRPVSSNRSDKITLYMPPETMRTLTALADYDEVSLTVLINNVLENYLPTRSDDIEFLQKLELMKEAHRQKQKRGFSIDESKI